MIFSQTQSLLAIADRLVSNIAPMSALIDRVVATIAPKTSATACYGSNTPCYWEDAGSCRNACWANFCGMTTSCVRIYKRRYYYGSGCTSSCTTACDIFVECQYKSCTVDANC